MEKIKVLLVDDHTVVRQGLRVLLEAEQDIAIVAEAETGRQAVQLARKHSPDVIVMGSPTVLVSGRPLARLMDPTAHGGMIVAGAPTVMVGP